jgi:pilus assembly protein CpaE
LAAILARRLGDNSVCFTDLDIQFGQGAMYLDLADAMTLTDILGGGGALADAPLASAIARHASGARVLGAPREMTPLDTLTQDDIDGLMKALRRDFEYTIIDLPSAWTAWTNRALHLCDRIVMVTNLSVSHVNLVKRQLRVMTAQGLDGIPLTLVCNQLGAEDQSVVSLKTAERALGRPFDVVVPEDRKLMSDAIAQGREISTIRSGSKMERAIAELATVINPVAATQSKSRKRLWS